MAKIKKINYIVCICIIITAIVLSVILKTVVFKMPDDSVVRYNAEEYLKHKYENDYLYDYEITSIQRDYGYTSGLDSWVVDVYVKEYNGLTFYKLYYDYIRGKLIQEYVEREIDYNE